jgi:hypothetical protein
LLFLNISLFSPLNDIKFILIRVCLLSYDYFGLSYWAVFPRTGISGVGTASTAPLSRVVVLLPCTIVPIP